MFNHNESLLYEWVEEHEPQLFEKIKMLANDVNTMYKLSFDTAFENGASNI